MSLALNTLLQTSRALVAYWSFPPSLLRDENLINISREFINNPRIWNITVFASLICTDWHTVHPSRLVPSWNRSQIPRHTPCARRARESPTASALSESSPTHNYKNSSVITQLSTRHALAIGVLDYLRHVYRFFSEDGLRPLQKSVTWYSNSIGYEYQGTLMTIFM